MVNDSLYDRLPNLILGFHGCNKDVFEKVIYEHEHLKQSSLISIFRTFNVDLSAFPS